MMKTDGFYMDGWAEATSDHVILVRYSGGSNPAELPQSAALVVYDAAADPSARAAELAGRVAELEELLEEAADSRDEYLRLLRLFAECGDDGGWRVKPSARVEELVAELEEARAEVAGARGRLDLGQRLWERYVPAPTASERVAAAIGNLADEFWQEGESGASYGGKAVAARLHMLRQELCPAPTDAERVAAAMVTMGDAFRSLIRRVASHESHLQWYCRCQMGACFEDFYAATATTALEAAVAALEARDE